MTKVNYTGYFLCVKYAAEIMKARFAANPGVWADIIQINSKSGLVGSKNNFAYAGSKFGAIGLTQSFALELVTYQIKVNAVCPGNTDTEMLTAVLEARARLQGRTPDEVRADIEAKTPAGRLARPSDIAAAVLFLTSPAAEYITGQALTVDGGRSLNLV